jgi:uncharacterized membrane protein YkoI
MDKRIMFSAAGAVVLVVAAGSAALGVNLGLLMAQQESSIGQLEVATASAELAPPVETVIIEEEVIIPAPEPAPAPAPAPTRAATATAPAASQPIDATRAVAIALATVGDGSLIAVEGEWSSGSAMFDVALRLPDGRRADILIDGTTGAVMGVAFEEPPAPAAVARYDDDDDDDHDDDDDDDDDDEDDD